MPGTDSGGLPEKPGKLLGFRGLSGSFPDSPGTFLRFGAGDFARTLRSRVPSGSTESPRTKSPRRNPQTETQSPWGVPVKSFPEHLQVSGNQLFGNSPDTDCRFSRGGFSNSPGPILRDVRSGNFPGLCPKTFASFRDFPKISRIVLFLVYGICPTCLETGISMIILLL